MLKNLCLSAVTFFLCITLVLAQRPLVQVNQNGPFKGKKLPDPGVLHHIKMKDGPSIVTEEVIRASISKATKYLREAQSEDGSFSNQSGIGVTAVCVIGLLQNGVSVNDPVVMKALKFLEGKVQKDGGIYDPALNFKNYECSLAIVALSAANKNGQYDKILKEAGKFIRSYQWDETENLTPSDKNYGGAGYGKHSRPDMSNTAFLMDALKSLGTGCEDPAVKKALIFVSRCQNFESEHNTLPYAALHPDGGFYYTCAGEGETKVVNSEKGLASYGSMTYAGLKSMIYAGVTENDARVKAALGWLSKNYTVKSNPGMGSAGLYYYYVTLGKAMNAVGHETFTDVHGIKHLWKQELSAELLSRQREDGSWVNQEASRWMENDANLVTGYALIALSYCHPGTTNHPE